MSGSVIMIVEDESIVALDLRMRLRAMGYTVSAMVASGEEAILKLVTTHPDLIIMDIRLHGEMDGIEAAEAIGAQYDIPVVFLTALNDPDTRQRAEITDSYGYIPKPFSSEELQAAIDQALAGRRGSSSE